MTNSLAALLDGVGIKLYDHIIVAPTETFSFRRGGLMGEETGAVTEAAQHFEQVLPAVQEEIYQNGTTKKGECRQCGKNDGEYLL